MLWLMKYWPAHTLCSCITHSKDVGTTSSKICLKSKAHWLIIFILMSTILQHLVCIVKLDSVSTQWHRSFWKQTDLVIGHVIPSCNSSCYSVSGICYCTLLFTVNFNCQWKWHWYECIVDLFFQNNECILAFMELFSSLSFAIQ